MLLIRYGMSYKRKKEKDKEIDDHQRILSSAGKFFLFKNLLI